jgi:general secretion pathway protein N
MSSRAIADDIPKEELHLENLHLENLEQTRARPLFSVTRRPPPKAPEPVPMIAPVAPPPPVVELPPPAITLIGTVLSPNEKTLIVSKPPDSKPLRFQIGDDIDGWRVVSIAARGAVIQHNDHSIELTFPKDKQLPYRFGISRF